MAEATLSRAGTSTVGGISPLTAAEARELTDRINRTAGDLCLLLLEAHEREAWRALGYRNWREYATAELNVSQSHAYRVLDHGRVTMALLAAVADDDAEISPNREKPAIAITEAEAREIKPLVNEVAEEVRERVAAGEPPEKAVKEVVKEAREIVRATDGDESEQHEPDLVQELEQALAENETLHKQLESLTVSDTAREIRSLHAQLAQLNANHTGTLNTLSEVRKQAEYGENMLRRIRKSLGVERDRDILTAIQSLQA